MEAIHLVLIEQPADGPGFSDGGKMQQAVTAWLLSQLNTSHK